MVTICEILYHFEKKRRDLSSYYTLFTTNLLILQLTMAAKFKSMNLVKVVGSARKFLKTLADPCRSKSEYLSSSISYKIE